MRPSERYRASLSLLTDLYQLTMAAGYHHVGIGEREACFTLSFRRHPFRGGYTIACGLDDALDYLEHLRFAPEDLDYLAGLRGADARPLFGADFLDHLARFRFTCDVDAVPEGTVVFPHQPLVRVTGPLGQAQLVETALLNILNFQTLIATKAARVCQAAAGKEVLEFGLRRAQGIDGALSAARAAYVGGCHATSNVLAGRLYDIPVRGTHAHSWVMAFDDERAAFRAYAEAMPGNCVLLVDTYDTLGGVRHAIDVGRELGERGQRLLGVRLDSGDLAYLSQEARKLLDHAGFARAAVVASGDLDEHIIESLEHQGAAIDVYGVGTRLVTGDEQPALGGVYKLSAVRDEHGAWRPRLKLSEQTVKVSTPGLLGVRRFRDEHGLIADAVYDTLREPPAGAALTIVDPGDPNRTKIIAPGTASEELLAPAMRRGVRTAASPPLATLRERTRAQLATLHPGIRRLENPHTYPAGLEHGLYEHKNRLIQEARHRS